MILRPISLLGAAAALLVPLVVTEVASAQYPPPPPPGYVAVPPPPRDGARFRGGVALEGGAFIAPGAVTLGAAGINGQLGVQINNNWGVYALPRFDIVFGSAGGVAIGGGVVGDYTFDNIPISVGLGPEFGVIAAIGGSVSSTGSSTAAAIGGAFYGATLHFAYHPIMRWSDFAVRRKALSIGVDLHILGGTYGAASETTTCPTPTGCTSGSASASVGHVALAPMITFGYTAF